jgi:hypothetical protein
MSDTPQLVSTDGAEGLVYRDAPGWDGLRTAAIGGFKCESATAGAKLLSQIATDLAAAGFGALIGPMDGDTWHRYRVVTETDGSRPYLMEPVSGPHDSDAFSAAGFTAISEYVSSRGALVDAIGPEPATMPGVRVTQWDGTRSEQLINRLFETSTGAFARNHFFKPIERAAFLKLYEPIIPLMDPRHIFFAHSADGTLIGFLFGIPDRLEGDKPQTVILKTYASGVRGVGHLLADSFHRGAIVLGHTKVIHALMHVDNVSLGRSRRYGANLFRRYALMGRRLQP